MLSVRASRSEGETGGSDAEIPDALCALAEYGKAR